jgi:hypothetical protein
MASKKYVCLAPVDNGKRHEIGEPITLDEKEAAPLLAVGAIVLQAATKKADEKD